MTKHLLLQDTNLSEIMFLNEGQYIEMFFLNMEDGQEEAIIRCRNILLFKFCSALSRFPLFIGEITHELIEEQHSATCLAQLGYGFSGKDGITFGSLFKHLQLLHIEGGEISIDIVCSHVDFDHHSK